MAEGLLREIKEEIGIELSESMLVFIDSIEDGDYFGKHIYGELYEVKLHTRPDILLSFEHDKYDWVPTSQLQIEGELFDSLIEKYKQGH